MFHHVQPRHFYSRDGTCTRRGFCRRPLSLVAFLIWYLLDRASIYEILVLMTRFQCTIRCIHLVRRSHLIVYCSWQWPHVTYVYYAYSWPLYSYISGIVECIFEVTCWYLLLYCTDDWLFLPPGSWLLNFWDGYNVFRPSCYPSDLTH